MGLLNLPKRRTIARLDVNDCPLPDLSLDKHSQAVSYIELFEKVARGRAPDAIISWLMCSRYDAIELAERLSTVGYTGHIIAISPVRLPKTSLVLRELKSCSSQISYEIWESAEGAQLSFDSPRLLAARA